MRRSPSQCVDSDALTGLHLRGDSEITTAVIVSRTDRDGDKNVQYRTEFGTVIFCLYLSVRLPHDVLLSICESAPGAVVFFNFTDGPTQLSSGATWRKVGLFTVILVGTRSSEFINTCLRDRWQDFSRQNYFDEHGIFMGVMWAGPLLILGFTMLVSKAAKRDSIAVAARLVYASVLAT